MTREEYYGTGNVTVTSDWNDAASQTVTNKTTGKTILLTVDAQNNGAADAFLRIYDNDNSTPVVPNTVSPLVTYMIPAGGGKVNEKNLGIELANGLTFAITSGAGDTDAGTVTNVDEVVVNLEYFDKF